MARTSPLVTAVTWANDQLSALIPLVKAPGMVSKGQLTPVALIAILLGAYLAVTMVSDVVDLIIDVVKACMAGRGKTRRFGEWAIVTGASDGIGKGVATELLRAGHRVAIVARNKDKLEGVRAEMLEAAKVKETDRVRVVVADFGDEDAAALYGSIKEQLGDALDDVGVLVNNVGVSYPGALRFEELADEAKGGGPDKSRSLVSVNVLSAVKMTEMVLAGMKERRRGAVVFISSAHGRMPIGAPLYAEYGASKAFVETFAKSLSHECSGSGVRVQVQYPYFVATKMAKIRKPTLFSPSPKNFAHSVVAAIPSGEVKVVPYWSHKIQDWIALRLPEFLLNMGVMSMHNGLRAAYLKKLKRKASEAKKDA